VFVADAGDNPARTDTVVLACTHYPLLMDRLAALAPWPVDWIDPAPAIARRVVDLLGPAGRDADHAGAEMVFTSGRRHALAETLVPFFRRPGSGLKPLPATSLRGSTCDEAIQSFAWGSGLLRRFAPRNDEGRPSQPAGPLLVSIHREQKNMIRKIVLGLTVAAFACTGAAFRARHQTHPAAEDRFSGGFRPRRVWRSPPSRRRGFPQLRSPWCSPPENRSSAAGCV